MPTHKSAAKRMKTAERDRLKNRKTKATLRNVVKDFKAGKAEDKAAMLKEVASVADTAARKHVIHKKKAARIKSRLAKSLKTK
ncbi:MAG TPA: 30S ribosomal protein S20 [candidate division Zixibacteria bacterium]|nr:30S ribosomal protein S20 [candidate division Zixibacteria bacterium]HBY99804.1 30S ribosomal protein S20 [candidate division Zixibacteria bacterium]